MMGRFVILGENDKNEIKNDVIVIDFMFLNFFKIPTNFYF